MRLVLTATVMLLISACGSPKNPAPSLQSGPGLPQLDFDPATVVVRARGVLEVSTKSSGTIVRVVGQSGTVPVEVVNAPAATFALDTSKFVPPTISADPLSFGSIRVSVLSDNQLRVCGTGGNQKCTYAILRVYTTGTAGPGLYNAADSWGAPITSTLTAPLSVGLDAANAAVMQTYTIPGSKRTLRLVDFSPSPTYGIHVDFTDAGAGTYSTTLVVEYALAL